MIFSMMFNTLFTPNHPYTISDRFCLAAFILPMLLQPTIANAEHAAEHTIEKETQKTAAHAQHSDHQHSDNSAPFSRTKINDHLFLLQGKGGNIAVLTGPEGLLIVDSDYESMSSSLMNELKTFQQPTKYVINTHWHGDHTGGNHLLGKQAPIIAHHNVHQRLSQRQEIPLFNMVSEPYPATSLPSITYETTLNLIINAETVKIYHLPGGHTDGDSVVLFEKANVLHTGDLYFNGMFPFVDLNSKGSVQQVAKNVATILATIDNHTVVIPGHGPLSNKRELTEFYRMLKGSLAEVKAMLKKGHSLKAIQDLGLSSQWDRWKNGFLNEANWLAIVHDSIQTQTQ